MIDTLIHKRKDKLYPELDKKKSDILKSSLNNQKRIISELSESEEEDSPKKENIMKILDLNDNLVKKVSELETIDNPTLVEIKTELDNQKKLIGLIRDEKAGGSILNRINRINKINKYLFGLNNQTIININNFIITI